MNIPALLEKYGRFNRVIGDYRACIVDSELGSKRNGDARFALERTMVKLAAIEDALEDMGLLRLEDRHSNRGDSQ